MRRPATQSKPASPKASVPVVARPRFPAWLMALFLGLATVALYWPATHHDFVNYDDEKYVVDNTHMRGGLTLENIEWALGTGCAPNWHPVTWLSHMLDCQLYGLKPRGHHFTSVLLHALNTMLVFLLLRQMTGATWRSVVVAALFGWHPVHVESVAWVAERKDVLSACFGLLSLIFYVRYTKFEIKNQKLKIKNYLFCLLFLALGLMSKPMLVTLPFVFLLLDYWPLKRVRNAECGTRNFTRMLFEKLPFFALAAVASVVTFIVQKEGGAMSSAAILPIGARIGNALISYCRYLGKLFWPTDLSVFYPYPGYWPLAKVLAAAGLLGAITILFFKQRQRHPFMLMGWLWFMGTLVPVIGLVQVGEQAMADRYTYIPSLGIFILVIWGVYELTRRWRYHVLALSAAGLAALVLCIELTRQQLGYWQDSETLMRHALAVTRDNYLAQNNLGVALYNKGHYDEAFRHFQEATRLNPVNAEAYNNLGYTLFGKGQIDEAIRQFQEALRLKPDFAEANNNLGIAFAKKSQTEEAIRQYQEALRLKPDYAEAYNGLGLTFAGKGQIDEAIRQYQQALRFNPDYAEAYNNLGIAFAGKGQIGEAISQYQHAIRLKPDFADAHNNLGNALGSKGEIDEAINQFKEAIRLNPDYAEAHNNLGIALAKKGQMDMAIIQLQEAVRLQPDYAEAHNNLGNALRYKGEIDEAIRQYQEAIRIKPDYANAYNNLGTALRIKGEIDEAISQYQEAIRLKPDSAEAHNNLGYALFNKGQIDGAISQYQQAIRLKPDFAEARDNLARALQMKNAPTGK